MGAAALAARIRLPLVAGTESPAECGLAFDAPGGHVVAVCGLVGGGGTSTLALCLARQAARESAAPILLTESSAERAGLAVLAGRAAPLCLRALASEVAAGRAPASSFVEMQPGLRLLAAPPRREVPAEPDAVRDLLRDASAAHGLVIVDCGCDWRTPSPVLDEASSIIWVLPARRAALAGADALLSSGALPKPGRWREALVTVALERRPSVSVRALRRLVADRCERLVLVPHCPRLAVGTHGGPIDPRVARALTALAPTLRRPR